MPLVGHAFHGVARTISIIALVGWVVSWPFPTAAAGIAPSPAAPTTTGLERASDRLGLLFDTIRSAPGSDWTVAAMAQTAAMSPRTLARRVQDATGMTPGQWIRGQRLAAARDLLETTGLSVEQVAQAVGMGTATNLRAHFTPHMGVPPQRHRQQFGQR